MEGTESSKDASNGLFQRFFSHCVFTTILVFSHCGFGCIFVAFDWASVIKLFSSSLMPPQSPWHVFQASLVLRARQEPGTTTLSVLTFGMATISVTTLSIMTLGIMTLDKMTLGIMTLSIRINK
jgi:hypothetical protein